MKWLSTEEIKRRAAISPEEALNVSIEEWEEKCEAIRRGEEARTGGEYCGVCIRANILNDGQHNTKCKMCCLNTPGVNCCQEYENFVSDETLPNAQAMLNRLYMERGKSYPAGEAQPYKEPKKEPCKEEKPELRHGDYGFSDENHPRLYLTDKGKPIHVQADDTFLGADKWFAGKMDEGGIVLGNIFDDLKRNAEDLRGFEIANGTKEGSLKITPWLGSCFEWKIETPSRYTMGWTTKELIEIHQKLGQLIATAKREQNSSYKK